MTGLRISMIYAAMLFAGTGWAAPKKDAGGVYGTWLRPDDGTTFTFFRCGGEDGLCVRVKGVRDAADAKLIGTMVFFDATKTAENRWKGQIYNAEDGQKYDGRITLNDPGSITFEGCVLGGSICRGESWTRVR